MTDVKQVLVIRRDLHVRLGKTCSQAAHASIAFLTSKMTIAQYGGMNEDDRDDYTVSASCSLSHAEEAWIKGIFTKICVRVDSEEELLAIHQKALEAGLVSHLIQDAGLTEFKNEDGSPKPTFTCAALGPDFSSKLDPITRHLKLL